MEIIQGIAGVVALCLFAALLGFDVRDMVGIRSRPDDVASIYDDPNSTMSVTREVIAEQLDQHPSEFTDYSQNWSSA